MQEMNAEELAAFHDNLADVLTRDGEASAQEYLGLHLSRLPEDLRNEIMGRIFFNEIVNEAQEIEAVAKAQQEGLDAIAVLETIKKELEKAEKAKS